MYTPKYKYILFLLLLLPLLGACSDDETTGIPSGGETPRTEARFEMKIKDTGSLVATSTRSTADESAINTLKLFIVPLDDNGNEIRNSNDIHVLDPISMSVPAPDGTITAVFASVLPVGIKHIYIAANLTAAQAVNVRNNWKYSLNSINNSEVVNPLKTGGIAMWKQVFTAVGNNLTTPDIEIVAHVGILADLQPITFERVVAKVMLAVEADAQGYVPISTNRNGWIKRDDVRYALDKTAKAFEWTKPAVPGNIQPEGLTGIVSYQDHNNAEWQSAEAPQQDPADYIRGIYCLENPAGNTYEQYNATRMVVGARYIPATLWIANGGNNVKRTYATIDQAIAAINAQKDPTATDNTYWCLDGEKFYTFQAVENIKLGMDMSRFSTYNGGWGYYLTLVNGITGNNQKGIQWDREKSVIHRNSRHILRITRFNPPGIGEMNELTFDENMYIYATVVDWNDKGGTNSDLEFNEAEQNKNQ